MAKVKHTHEMIQTRREQFRSVANKVQNPQADMTKALQTMDQMETLDKGLVEGFLRQWILTIDDLHLERFINVKLLR